MSNNSVNIPAVSVIIPVYNQEKYIRECVESALSQDYERLEVIVVDDGSSDETPSILKAFGQKIVYIRQENQGPANALNTGLRLSRGDFIAWLSSDDLFLPKKITFQVQKLQNEPSLSLVYTDAIIIDAKGGLLTIARAYCPPRERFARELIMNNFINGSSVLIRKECFEKVGYFDEALKADVDGEMWLRLLKYYRFGHLSQPLIKYRIHAQNLSHNLKLMRRYMDIVRLKALSDYLPEELFADYSGKNFKEVGWEYEKLAWQLGKRALFKSAHFALKRSQEISSISLGRVVWSLVLRIIGIEPLTQLFFLFYYSRRRRKRKNTLLWPKHFLTALFKKG